MRSGNWRNEFFICRGMTGSGRKGKYRSLFSVRKRKKKSRQAGLKGRRGSAVVLLCILFVTIAGALAATYEAADRKAAINLSEAAFDSAGRSILACYDKPLFERYGIFAFEGDEDKTEKRLKKIAELSVGTPRVAGCRVDKVEAEQAAYALTDPDNLMLQIREITKRSAVVDVLGSLKEEASTAEDKVKEKKQAENKAKELEEEREEAKRRAEEAVERARQAAEEDGDQEAVEAASSAELSEIEDAEKVQNDLKARADSITGEKNSYDSEGRSLKNGRVSESLPSAAAGCKEKRAYAGGSVLKDLSEDGTGEALGDDLITTGYIESYFRNELDEDSADDHFFRCEVEYILYGCMSDEENYKKAYHSIFAVRTAVNTAYLYMDPEKSALILATAEAMTPGPFAPLTQVLLTLAWAAVESENDMKNLEAGNGVPLIKNSATWMTDIDGAAKGASGGEDYIPVPGDSHMTYSRYLDMLLLTLDRDTKLYRIMDLIQINLKGTERADFTMSDHFTGLALKAEIAKKSHAVGVVDSTAEINMIHTYLTGG